MKNFSLKSTPEGKKAEELADFVGAVIPDSSPEIMWSLPILLRLLERIEKLEKNQRDVL